MSLKRGSCSHG